jgi:hypothetical protein
MKKAERIKNLPSCNRRQFLKTGVVIAGAGACLLAAPGFTDAREVFKDLNGSAEPYPIPWLDKNGSHNQSPAPGTEPSNIYHFKGLVARANNFTGAGSDNKGNRIAFGAPSTDFSFMSGEYFDARAPKKGTFSHI